MRAHCARPPIGRARLGHERVSTPGRHQRPEALNLGQTMGSKSQIGYRAIRPHTVAQGGDGETSPVPAKCLGPIQRI